MLFVDRDSRMHCWWQLDFQSSSKGDLSFPENSIPLPGWLLHWPVQFFLVVRIHSPLSRDFLQSCPQWINLPTTEKKGQYLSLWKQGKKAIPFPRAPIVVTVQPPFLFVSGVLVPFRPVIKFQLWTPPPPNKGTLPAHFYVSLTNFSWCSDYSCPLKDLNQCHPQQLSYKATKWFCLFTAQL
jgi:hypothetical protein